VALGGTIPRACRRRVQLGALADRLWTRRKASTTVQARMLLSRRTQPTRGSARAKHTRMPHSASLARVRFSRVPETHVASRPSAVHAHPLSSTDATASSAQTQASGTGRAEAGRDHGCPRRGRRLPRVLVAAARARAADDVRSSASQSTIARLESGAAKPSLSTLRRLAQATGMRLKISLEPKPRSKKERGKRVA